MKITILIPVLFITAAASAQTQRTGTLPDILKNKNTGTHPGISNWNCLPEKFDFKKIPIPKASLKNSTPSGKVYGLPQDNMPCLATDKALTSAIPKALPVQVIIPAKLFLGPVSIPKRPLLRHQVSHCGRSRMLCSLPAI